MQIVSPIRVSVTFLMLAMTHPTSPTERESHETDFGVRYPRSSTSYVRPVDQRRILVPFAKTPSTIRASMTTPR